MSIIELSTGHVFASGSVRVVGPLILVSSPGESRYSFSVLGAGFVVEIHIAFSTFDTGSEVDGIYEADWDRWHATAPMIRQEAIDKLLGDSA